MHVKLQERLHVPLTSVNLLTLMELHMDIYSEPCDFDCSYYFELYAELDLLFDYSNPSAHAPHARAEG